MSAETGGMKDLDVAQSAKLDTQVAYGVDMSLSVAGLGGRSYAFVIDWHIRALLAGAWALLILLGTIIGEEAFGIEKASPARTLLMWVPALLVYLLYHPVLEVLMHGSTPGKRMAGVRVVDISGHPPTTGAIIIRNVFRMVDSLPSMYLIGIIATIFTGNRVRLGDLAAHTVLVYDEQVGKKALDAAVNVRSTKEGSLSEQDAELVTELLTRWHQLDQEMRIKLATILCERVGWEVPAHESHNILDRALHDLLKKAAV